MSTSTGPQGKPGLRQRAASARGTARKGAGYARWVAAGRKPYTARGLLTAELLAGVGIVAMRAVADYEPQADGTIKGKIGHPKGQYGPLPVLAGLIGTFFVLSFLAARGGTRAKIAVAGGALIILVLGMKSLDEFDTVGQTFATFGKATPPDGDWQTSGDQAGSPIDGGSITTAPPKTAEPNKSGKCPAGYAYDPGTRQCVSTADWPPLPPPET